MFERCPASAPSVADVAEVVPGTGRNLAFSRMIAQHAGELTEAVIGIKIDRGLRVAALTAAESASPCARPRFWGLRAIRHGFTLAVRNRREGGYCVSITRFRTASYFVQTASHEYHVRAHN